MAARCGERAPHDLRAQAQARSAARHDEVGDRLRHDARLRPRRGPRRLDPGRRRRGRLLPSVSGGVGFSGIAVALLGALVPAGIVIAALFFSALVAGAVGMQSATGSVPSSIAEVIKGVLVLGVACIAAVQRRPAAVVAPSGPSAAPAADAEETDA